MNAKLVCTLLLLICNGGTTADLDTSAAVDVANLELVQIVFRHGDRSPLGPFPTDTHKDFWTDGLGQLSNIGKEQQYELGQFIRQRYGGFLNASYNYQDVRMNSTGSDRTLMSAESHLAGLYAPSGEQVWNPDIDWQPVPVFTIPENLDYICGVDAYCPKFDQLFDETKKSPEMQEINAENADLYALIANYTGSQINDIYDVNNIYDTLFCEQSHNLTWPSWVEPVWSQIVDLENLNFVYKYGPPEQARLRGGPLLGNMIDNMELAIDSKLGHRKAFIISSHDSMVAALLCALNIYNDIQPPYASAVLVELYRTEDGQHSVQIAYKNTTGNADPYILTIPECTELCPFYQFVNLTANSIPEDILEECGVTTAELGKLLNTGRRSKQSSSSYERHLETE